MAPCHEKGSLQFPPQLRQRLGHFARREVARRQILKKAQPECIRRFQQTLAANERGAHRLNAGRLHPAQRADGLLCIRRRMPHDPPERTVLRRRGKGRWGTGLGGIRIGSRAGRLLLRVGGPGLHAPRQADQRSQKQNQV